MTRFMFHSNATELSDSERETIENDILNIREQGYLVINGKEYKLKN